MATANTLSFQVAVGLDGLVEGLRVATKTTQQSTEQIRDSLGGTLPKAAKDAEGAHEKLIGKLKEFASEQRTQGRMSRFYAGEIASIIPAAGSAGGAIQGLLGAGLELAAGGGAIAVGFELAKVGIEAASAAMEDGEKHAKAMSKAYTDAFTAARDGALGLVTVSGGVMAQWDKDTAASKKRIADLRQEIDELQTGSFGRGVGHVLSLGLMDTTDTGGIQKRRDEIERLTTGMHDAREARDVASNAKRKQQEADVSREIESIRAASADRIAQIDAALQVKIAEIGRREFEDSKEKQRLIAAETARAEEDKRRVYAESDLAQRQAHLNATKETMSRVRVLREQAAIDIARMEEEKERLKDTRLRAHYDQQIADRKTTLVKQLFWERTAQIQAMNDLAKAAEDGQRSMLERQLAYQQQQEQRLSARMQTEQSLRLSIFEQGSADYFAELKRQYEETVATFGAASKQAESFLDRMKQEQIENAKAQAKAFVGGAAQIGEAFGTAFAEMASGAKEFGAAMAGVLKKTIQMVIAAAQQQILASAAASAAKAYESQAGIPIVGPILGAAAMATALGVVSGLVGSLPSARGGFDIPNGLNPVTQLHEREMVLPAKYADVIRDAADGGGGLGGGVMQVTIQAWDGEDVIRVLESGRFDRALAERRRNGRMA